MVYGRPDGAESRRPFRPDDGPRQSLRRERAHTRAIRIHLGQSWDERITRYQPPHLPAITWEGGEAGEVAFALSDEGGKTLLVLTHTGLRGRDDAVNFGAGWHSHLAVLERRIKGDAVPDFWALHGQAEEIVEKTLKQPRA